MRRLFLVASLLLLASTSRADDITVPGDFPTIQAAINAATAGDRVLVGPGTYAETISLKDGVEVTATDGPTVTTIDAELQARAVAADSVSAVFQGFTVTGGSSMGNGGGMSITGDSQMTITNCYFLQNTAGGRGGGLAVQSGGAQVTQCRFSDNLATEAGGGIFVKSTLVDDVQFDDCKIYLNSATGPGGGIHVQAGACRVLNSQLHDNSCNSNGGGIALDEGASIEVDNCLVYSNTAAEGGGFSFNNSSGGQITHTTLYANTATLGGGMSFTNGSSPTISTTIIANSSGAPAAAGLPTMNCGQGSNPVVSCCDLFGNSGGDAICGTDGGNNIFVDPQFCRVDPLAEGNFTLQFDSPCSQPAPPCGDPIGGAPVDCGTDPVEPATWGQIKSTYR